MISGSRPESSEDDHPQYSGNGNPPALLLDPMAIHMMPPEYDRPLNKKSSMIEKMANGLSKLHFSNSSFGPKGSLV